MKIFTGAETLNTPLGNNAEENFRAIRSGHTVGRRFENCGYNNEAAFLVKFDPQKPTEFKTLLHNGIDDICKKIAPGLISSPRTLLVLSTTKGDIAHDIRDGIASVCRDLISKYDLKKEPLAISNACISGVLAIIVAADHIRAGLCDHAVVAGCDVISDFVLYGFQSLMALSDEQCRPFDKNRKGINLGEGFGAVVLSRDKDIFKDKPLVFVAGSSSNDANHISGPSRTGEGLYRSVQKTLKLSGLESHHLDFISAHGTATSFNDEMEAIAFDRLKMNSIPVNSLKGWFGHTLGAAGLIETAISMIALRNNLLIKSQGFETTGISKSLNIIVENEEKEIDTFLKTASGFGGCNATLVIQCQ